MTSFSRRGGAALCVGFVLANLAPAGPVTGDEARRRTQVLDRLQKAIAAEPTAAAKFAHLAKAIEGEPAVDLRRRIVDLAVRIPGPELDTFLAAVLAGDADAGLRSHAASALGRVGSEKSLAALAQAAATDRTTELQIGCMVGRSNARRAATFALADLAERFPARSDEAAAKLRALPVVADPKDNEQLADARTQALYRVTRDAALLKPYAEQLVSRDAAERERGVIAFRFLKPKEAPADLVATLKDSSPGVRSWSALVLGEVGDPKTGPVLLAVAGDAKEELGIRCSAIFSLGHMKFAAAAGPLERMLEDAAPSIQTNAAIALYRITGKKVKQFPEGYNAD